MRVIDPRLIAYRSLELAGDLDLEDALRDQGWEPEATQYRLLQLPIDVFSEVATMRTASRVYRGSVSALKARPNPPPVVAMQVDGGFILLDGFSRLYAHWALGRPTIRAHVAVPPA